MSSIVTPNPDVEQVISVNDQLAETDHVIPSAGLFTGIVNLVLRWPFMVFLHGLWTDHQVATLLALGEEEDITKPESTLNFVIVGLLSFTAIKSQAVTGFPFQTHPQACTVSVTSLLIYGWFSAVERSAVYAIIARLGRKGSLYVLVGSLAYLFYF